MNSSRASNNKEKKKRRTPQDSVKITKTFLYTLRAYCRRLTEKSIFSHFSKI
jgi:hypothetical protein